MGEVLEDVNNHSIVGGSLAGSRSITTEARLHVGTVEKQGAGSTAGTIYGAAEGAPHTDTVTATEMEGPRASD